MLGLGPGIDRIAVPACQQAKMRAVALQHAINAASVGFVRCASTSSAMVDQMLDYALKQCKASPVNAIKSLLPDRNWSSNKPFALGLAAGQA